ncbi:hypothetical protein J6590_103699, partial [Homalodisca vitripennis]
GRGSRYHLVQHVKICALRAGLQLVESEDSLVRELNREAGWAGRLEALAARFGLHYPVTARDIESQDTAEGRSEARIYRDSRKGTSDPRIRLPDLTQEHLPSEGRPQAGKLPTRTMSGGVYSGSLVRPVLPPGFPEGDPSIPVSGYPISTRVTQTPILRIHRGFPPEGRVTRSHRGAPPAKRRPQVTRVAARVLIIRRSQTRADSIAPRAPWRLSVTPQGCLLSKRGSLAGGHPTVSASLKGHRALALASIHVHSRMSLKFRGQSTVPSGTGSPIQLVTTRGRTALCISWYSSRPPEGVRVFPGSTTSERWPATKRVIVTPAVYPRMLEFLQALGRNHIASTLMGAIAMLCFN